MNKRRLLSALLVVALALSLCSPVFAASFSDLGSHWAKSYMEDLADRGYLSGYEDGTMGPEKEITGAETLALLSRFYTLDDETVAWIYEDNAEAIAGVVPATLTWAYDEVAVCMAANIVSAAELVNIDLTKPIKKEMLAVLLVRAMQLTEEAEALGTVVLSFNDASSITSAYRRYVKLLVDAGIVEGDDTNNFAPQSSLKRCIVATMVSRALDYVESRDIELLLPEYLGGGRTEGVVVSFSGSKLKVRGFDGLTREYSITSSARITVNGTASELNSSAVGDYAVVTVDEAGAVSVVALTRNASVVYAQGVLARANTLSSYTVVVTDLDTGTDGTYTYTNASDVKVTEDGKTIAFSGLKRGYFVTVVLTSGKVTEVNTVSAREQSGTISAITYGATITLAVTDGTTVYSYLLDISDLPTIKRGDVVISVDRLKVGDEIKLTVLGGTATAIVAEGSANTISGVINSIVTTVNGTSWVLTADAGTTHTFSLDSQAAAYKDGKSVLLSTISVGDKVTVVTFGDVVTEVYVEESASNAVKVEGKVLTVNTTTKEVVILSDGKLIYVDLSSAGSILSSSTGYTVRIADIKADNYIVAYGSYTTANNFKASSVVIES